ncbi:MAG: hypothetical protein A2287_06635 [Candidatus Melainabacteria bacterium RIFOXYA12_FULL_32_12]|nr:MAG: hypothetical protein A2255_09700 [Candidatus Melainabacteria bacterium RIFOXYA2_FULL_32_9]OGI26887.1 MAG: hypothetical protein A2287_06635 [Candidatus Melainabacteria bacterium RIFOXYA12_FULL_32_12]
MLTEVTYLRPQVRLLNNKNSFKEIEKKQEEFSSFNKNDLAKPSVENLKANFITFTGDKSNKEDSKPYEKPAELLALNLASGHQVNLVYKEGSEPSLVIDSFSKMLTDGKFENMGFSPNKTSVWALNTSRLINENRDFRGELTIKANEAKKRGGKLIVFIQDFPEFLAQQKVYPPLINKPVPPFILFEDPRLENVKFVGITSEESYEEYTDKKNPYRRSEDNLWLKHFKKVALSAPSPEETKEMLKEPKCIKDFLSDDLKHIKFSDEAIDTAVDLTVTVSGEFPDKAMKLLRLAIANKANKGSGYIDFIDKKDIEDVYKTYPELLEFAKSKSGAFQVIHNSKVRLSDVGGIGPIKREIKEDLLDYMNDPKKLQSGDMPKGVLLYGTPGTGKTLLAKAVAGEAGVPFVATSGSEFIEKYVGVGAQRVREVFDLAVNEARKNSKKTAIVFIDEIDAFAKKRGSDNSGGSSETTQTLDQLLAEMDGISNHSDVNIIVMAATNHKDMLDDALTRPGRFDLQFNIPNPSRNKKARREILEIHAKNKPFKNEEEKQRILNLATETTEGFSGAELADLMKRGKRMVDKPDRTIPYITESDIQEAKLQLKFGLIKEYDDPEWSADRTKKHELGHAVSNLNMNQAMLEPWNKPVSDIDLITFEPRGGFLGAVTLKPGENTQYTFDSVIADIVSAYGGYITEKAYYGTNSVGVSQDLDSATGLAYRAITEWGLGPNTGVKSIGNNKLLEKIYESKVEKDIDLFTTTAVAVTEKIIKFNKGFIDFLLEDSKTGKIKQNLSGEEFKQTYDKWIKENGKEKELSNLHREIRETIENAQRGKLPIEI